MMDWLKLHHEARRDAKLGTLTDAQHRGWFHLLILASEQVESRGTIPPMKERVLALEVTGGDIAILRETLAALVDLDIVKITPEGAITFLAFDKRNTRKPSDEADATAQRQREKRARDKGVTDAGHAKIDVGHAMSRDVTRCHALDKRRGEENREEGEVVHASVTTEDPSLPPPPVPGLPKGAGHPYSQEQIARLKAAMPEGNTISPQQVPYQLGVMLSRAVESNTFLPMVQSAWREMEPEQKVVWTCEAMRRVAHKEARYRFKDAAEHIGKALEGGYDMLKDGWKPPASVTNISAAPSKQVSPHAGRPWFGLWTIVTGLPDAVRFKELVRDYAEMPGMDIDTMAAHEAFAAGGVAAGMDYLWAAINGGDAEAV